MHHAAGAGLGRQQPDDAGTDLLADPRPETVHGDEVRLGNRIGLGAGRELREVRLDEADIVETGSAGEPGADGDVGGIVIDGRDLPAGIGGGGEQGADSDAATEFQIAGVVVRLGQIRRHVAEQAGQRQPRR